MSYDNFPWCSGQQNNIGCQRVCVLPTQGYNSAMYIILPAGYTGNLELVIYIACTGNNSTPTPFTFACSADYSYIGNVVPVNDLYPYGASSDPAPVSGVFAGAGVGSVLFSSIVHMYVSASTEGVNNAVLVQYTNTQTTQSYPVRTFIQIRQYQALGAVVSNPSLTWLSNTGVVTTP